MKIRPTKPTDADAISKIVFDAFGSIARTHNFPLDFPAPEAAQGLANMFLNHSAIHGFAAEEDGKIVGSNFLDRRDAIAGVGPITVDPAAQSKGVGRKLMEAVIECGKDSPGIRLVQDAFNTTSMSLYASLGFEAKEPLALMRGKPKEVFKGADARPMRDEDVPACAVLCKRVHGFDRANELRDAMKMFKPFVLVRGGGVAAYCSAPTFWVLNHGVAETETDMQQLLLAAGSANDEPLMMLIPIRQAKFFRWCLSQGLRVVKPMTLMAMGEYREPKGCWFPSVAY